MTVTQRVMLAGLAAGGALAERAEACTVVATQRRVAFSDDGCRRELRELVAMINTAPSLTDAVLTERLRNRADIRFDQGVTDPLLDYPKIYPIESADVIRGWSMSEGKRDRAPIRLTEVTLFKGERGFGFYQFTLRRDRFMAEVTDEMSASDTCASPEPAHWYAEDHAYLAAFQNNKLREVSAFDVWLRGA